MPSLDKKRQGNSEFGIYELRTYELRTYDSGTYEPPPPPTEKDRQPTAFFMFALRPFGIKDPLQPLHLLPRRLGDVGKGEVQPHGIVLDLTDLTKRE